MQQWFNILFNSEKKADILQFWTELLQPSHIILNSNIILLDNQLNEAIWLRRCRNHFLVILSGKVPFKMLNNDRQLDVYLSVGIKEASHFSSHTNITM